MKQQNLIVNNLENNTDKVSSNMFKKLINKPIIETNSSFSEIANPNVKKLEQNNENFYTSYSKLHEIKFINIGLASSDQIRQWAEKTLPNGKILGQVTNANTLHHKTFKPQKGGLFCERIFGPLKDFECACGKSQKFIEETKSENFFIDENPILQQTKRKFCPTCDVEYTWSVIRRYQLGYIQLVSPVTHIWYLKGMPSYLSILLDMKKKHLEQIIYCSETMTLENALKKNTNLFMNSPSTLFVSWKQNMKGLVKDKEKTFVNKKTANSVLLSSDLNKRNSILRKNKKPERIHDWRNSMNFFIFDKKINDDFNRTLKSSMKKNMNFSEQIQHNKNINDKNINAVFLTKLKTTSLKQLPIPFYVLSKLELMSQKKAFLLASQQAWKNFYKKTYSLAHKKANFLFKTIKKDLNNNKITDYNTYKIFEKNLNKTNKNFLNLKQKKANQKMDFFLFNLKNKFLTQFYKRVFYKSLYNQKLFNQSRKKKTLASKKSITKASLKSLGMLDFDNIKTNQEFYNKLKFFQQKDFLNKKHISKLFLIYKKLGINLSKLKQKTKHFYFLSKLKKTNIKHLKNKVYSPYIVHKNVRILAKKRIHSNNSFVPSPKPKLGSIKTNYPFNFNDSKSKLFLKSKKQLILCTTLNYLKTKSESSNNTNRSRILRTNFLPKHNFFYSLKTNLNYLFVVYPYIKTPGISTFILRSFCTFDTISQQKSNFNITKKPELQNQILNTEIINPLNKFLVKIKHYFRKHVFNFIQNQDNHLIHIQDFVYFNEEKIVLFMANVFAKQMLKNTEQLMELVSDEMVKPILKYQIIRNLMLKNTNNFKINNKIKKLNSLLTNESKDNSLTSSLNNELTSNTKSEILNVSRNSQNNNINLSTLDENFSNKKINKINNGLNFEQNEFLSSMKINDVLKLKQPEKNKIKSPIPHMVDSFKTKHLFNNIYCLSHRYTWQTEKDWKYFLLYTSASPNFEDKPIFAYKNRMLDLKNFDTSSEYLSNLKNTSKSTLNLVRNTESKLQGEKLQSVDNTLTGAGLIKKLLSEFDFHELKKMDKQNRILLYELKKKISKFKKLVNLKYADGLDKKQLRELCKKRDQLMRRTKLTRKLYRKNSNPESMILSVLPVLPPDLRPILKIGDQIAASDLNRLYQRVIYRNIRLKKFLKDPATAHSSEMKYAQRLLQEAVDNLIENGKGNVTAEKDSHGRSLKSLSDILKGKQGRFRQHLLGKRVDYSGRSVIVVGPKLKLHQCGLPKEMALELFLPFLLKKIIHSKLARTVIGAKTIIKTNPALTIEMLTQVMQNHPILLNRAPTLHRLGIQAFLPKLVDGRAILLHPLVCPGFNADFDGDQMAVHVPITIEARSEAWKLMLARNNLLSPATGEPILLPSQDMVLGCYYLTTESNKYQQASNSYFSDIQQVMNAYYLHKVDLHATIWVKLKDVIENANGNELPIEIRIDSNGYSSEIFSKYIRRFDSKANLVSQYIRTTPGRILFNLIIQECMKNSVERN